MDKLIRFYNQNRGAFWIIVIIIIGVIGLIQFLNNYYKDKNSSGINSTTTYNAIQNPIISGENIENEINNKATAIINEFINSCNNNDIKKAYSLLSNECKKELYPTIDDFKENYHNRIFTEYKIYDIKSWITTSNRLTYKINITSDMLVTGKTDNLSIEEYYTIVKEDKEYKLNIHNFIGKDVINSKKTLNNVDFEIAERYIYIEYEIYRINVKNKSNKKIMLDSRESTKNINILDQNNLKYIAFLNEINKNDLIIYPGIKRELNIKFNKSYNPEYSDKYIEFLDIIMDLDNNDKKDQIKIEL